MIFFLGFLSDPESSEAPSACSMALYGQGHAKGAPASVASGTGRVLRYAARAMSSISAMPSSRSPSPMQPPTASITSPSASFSDTV